VDNAADELYRDHLPASRTSPQRWGAGSSSSTAFASDPSLARPPTVIDAGADAAAVFRVVTTTVLPRRSSPGR
jgi:hypothetical protein